MGGKLMKNRMVKRMIALASVAAMAVTGCGAAAEAPAAEAPAADDAAAEEEAEAEEAEAEEEEEEEEEEIAAYTVITDEDGNPIDLGGMDIIIRDWWSGDPAEPTNDYEEARQEWREWIQETYNFTIKEQAISDWGSTPQDFVDYATTGGDENYVFILRPDPTTTSAMSSGLMYDLSTLDCLDFSTAKFQSNKNHVLYSRGDAIYGMAAGLSEPRTGIYFNKRVLTEAGIDPESIYDMQADGTWTWDKFDELMGQVHRDTDNDGVIDVFGLCANEGDFTTSAIFSNNGSYIGKDDNGYFYNLESAETTEALEWTVDMFTKYDDHDPEGAEWDYYKEEFLAGHVGFMPDGFWAGAAGAYLEDIQDEVGFVMFPKGPQGTDYINVWDNNIVSIPACYDADKAWKIAFAWNLYTDEPAGYEDYNGNISRASGGIFDQRAVNETVVMMSEPQHGTVAFHGLIPNLDLGPDFVWGIGVGSVVSEAQEAIRDSWTAYVEEANK